MRKDGYINPITKALEEIYVKDGIDIFGFQVSEDNFITYHHIIKCEDLKNLNFKTEKTIENGIALSHYGHGYLHFIEDFAPEIFNKLNKIILLLVKERRTPNDEEKNLITNLFLSFEYMMDKYRKIPEQFLKRSFN